MKLLIPLLLLVTLAAAQQPTTSTIEKATVYLSGAKITRSASFNVVSGENKIQLSNLSPNIDESSVQVFDLDGMRLLGINYDIKQSDEKFKTDAFVSIQKRIDSTTLAIEGIEGRLAGLNEELLLLQSNRNLNSKETGLSLEQIKSFGSYYKERTEDIVIQRTSLNNTLQDLMTKKQNLLSDQRQLDPSANDRQGSLQLKLYSRSNKRVSIQLSYNVSQAGWIPIYDIIAQGTGDSVTLDFKGQIYQQTGSDWNNVAVTLSTGDPNVDNTKPELEEKRLRFVNSYSNYKATTRSNKKYNPTVKTVRGKITDMDGSPILGATVTVEGTNQSVTTDFDGNYAIDVKNGKALRINYAGYGVTRVPIYASVINETLTSSLDAVVVSGYKANSVRMDNMEMEAMEVPAVPSIVVEDNIASRTYTLPLTYSIPSADGTTDVSISSNNVASTFEYYTAPVINENVFLTAILKGYESLNLVPGEANIYFDGSYNGKIYFDTDTTEEDLTISLGVDPQITVERKELTDRQSTSFLGSNRIIEKRYEITLKNNRKSPVVVKLQDRIPVSSDEEIKVDDVETGTATVDKSNILTWMVNLATAEQVKKTFSYRVKYPKGRRINLN